MSTFFCSYPAQLVQLRPQGFSLKKWVGREKPWGRGCNWCLFKGDIAKVIQIWSTLTSSEEFVEDLSQLLISQYNIVDATYVACIDRPMWETGTQCDVSITCFRFGKIPTPANFSLARRFWVFSDVVSACYSEKLHWYSEGFELWSWRSPEESLRLCPFCADYTSCVGHLCAESLPMIQGHPTRI